VLRKFYMLWPLKITIVTELLVKYKEGWRKNTTPQRCFGDTWSILGDTSQRKYRVADKSLARPGRKQARTHVREARDFNKIETRAVIKFLFLLGKTPKEIHATLTETLGCFFPGRTKSTDLGKWLTKCWEKYLNLSNRKWQEAARSKIS